MREMAQGRSGRGSYLASLGRGTSWPGRHVALRRPTLTCPRTGSMLHGCGSFREGRSRGSGDFPGQPQRRACPAGPLPSPRRRGLRARGTHDARGARGLWRPAHVRAWPGRHRSTPRSGPAAPVAPGAPGGPGAPGETAPTARPATPALTGPGHHRDRAPAAPAQSRHATGTSRPQPRYSLQRSHTHAPSSRLRRRRRRLGRRCQPGGASAADSREGPPAGHVVAASPGSST